MERNVLKSTDQVIAEFSAAASSTADISLSALPAVRAMFTPDVLRAQMQLSDALSNLLQAERETARVRQQLSEAAMAEDELRIVAAERAAAFEAAYWMAMGKTNAALPQAAD